MIKHFKRLSSQVLIYGLGDAVNKIVLLLTLPLFTRYLSPRDYGVAAILTVASSLITGIADLGITMGVFRFYKEEKDEDGKKMISTAQIAVFITAFLMAIIATLLANPISSLFFKTAEYRYLVLLTFWTMPLTVLTSAPLMRLRLEDRAKKYTFIVVSRFMLSIALNVLLIVFLKRGIKGYFEGPFITATIFAIIIGLSSLWTNGISFSRELFKKMFLFGSPFLLGMLSFWIMDWADRFILARLTNLSEVGLYNLGYSIGMAILLPVTAFSTAWAPFYISVYKEPNAKKIYSLIFTYYSLVVGFLVLIIAIFARDYFRLFTPAEFHGAYIVVPLVTMAYAFKGHFDITAVGSFLVKRPVLQFYTEIIAMILNIATMFVLIPYLGIVGAAWATFVAYLSLPFIILIFSRKIYPIQYEYSRIFQILFVGLIVYFVADIIYQPGYWNILFRFGVVLLYPILFLLLGFFKEGEINQIMMLKNKVLKRG